MEKKALLSDEQAYGDEGPALKSMAVDRAIVNYVRDIYEAERTKLLDLLQQGVDAMDKFGQGSSMGASHPHLSNYYVAFDEKTWHDRRAFLAACKDVGIEPSQD